MGRAESAVVEYTEYALDMQNLQKMHGLDFTNAWKYRGIQMQSQTWMINDHGVSLSSVYGEDGEDDEDLPGSCGREGGPGARPLLEAKCGRGGGGAGDGGGGLAPS